MVEFSQDEERRLIERLEVPSKKSGGSIMVETRTTKAAGARMTRIVISSLETDLYTPLSGTSGSYPTIAEALALVEKKSPLFRNLDDNSLLISI